MWLPQVGHALPYAFGDVGAAAAVEDAGAPVQQQARPGGGGGGTLRRQQAEEGGAVERAEHGGAEQRVLGGARLDVGVVEALHAAVEAADAPRHAFLPEQLDGRADGQDEEGAEEVHHVLARLREQQPLRLPVDEELHAQRRRRRRRVRGCHQVIY